MTCNEAGERIAESLLGELGPERSELLRGHLAACARCRSDAEELRSLWAELGALVAPAPDAAAARLTGARLRAALAHDTEDTSTRRRTMITERESRRGLLAAAVVAALLVGGAAGYGVGRTGEAPAAEGHPQFLLLLHESEESLGAEARVGTGAMVSEYAAWAGSLAREGKLVSAEKLAEDGGRWLARGDAGGRSPARISGFFLIRAADYAEAAEIARRSPHLKYGGRIELRAIEDTGG